MLVVFLSHCLPYISRSLNEPGVCLSLLPHNQYYRSVPLGQPLIFFLLNLLVCIHAHAIVRVRRSKGSARESVLSFHRVSPGDGTHVASLGGGCWESKLRAPMPA